MSLSPTMSPGVADSAPQARHGAQLRVLLGVLRQRIVAAIGVLNARRALHAELIGLDHRELDDLGIDPGGIDGFVAAWKPTPRR
ncbi:hypothetical protein CU669_13165 [Paramagnetospirillum kuznetsovii]|uniref:DUF1127 domain-containing protein n=1 Tax=Paramagnetospirillum kuznetsovii TaxID=2053833 RepID=A0A364NWC5_9PROT|nr:DUF1127 domain-containing protein [Paramagnetospirillum kuznetsovii]RAU21378.1 hypothetical protein CU669_13165 [Paramagnetospirillum kuznetsovii]